MRDRFAVPAVLICLAAALPARAEPIPVGGYDITDAAASGFGFWQHTYFGTITPTSFVPFPYDAQVANYAGGGGTLNDGIIGGTTDETQLFVQGNLEGVLVQPVITLKLGSRAEVKSLKLYGGNIDLNFFPGQLTGVTVQIGGQSVALPTIDTGPTGILGVPWDDIVDLTGTGLDTIPTDTVVLRDFVFPADTFGQFTISEIEVDGVPAAVRTVGLDVKPEHAQNVISLVGAPTVKVLILGAADFDVGFINQASLTFGRTGTEASLVRCKQPRDRNRDRFADLECRFSVRAAGFQLTDTNAVLKGLTTTNEPFQGVDHVVIVNTGPGDIDRLGPDDPLPAGALPGAK